MLETELLSNSLGGAQSNVAGRAPYLLLKMTGFLVSLTFPVDGMCRDACSQKLELAKIPLTSFDQ